MNVQIRHQRSGVILLILSCAIAAAAALYAYTFPLTGVTGTVGPLIIIAASALIALAAIILAGLVDDTARVLLQVAVFFALFGTAFAGYLLRNWFIPLAMVLGGVGLILTIIPARTAHGKG